MDGRMLPLITGALVIGVVSVGCAREGVIVRLPEGQAGQRVNKSDDLPRLPRATLLVGYPPGTLMVTTRDATSQLQVGGVEWYVTPSMSADGRIVASARTPDDVPHGSRLRYRMIVGTYSMADKKWTDYEDLAVFDGSVSISPDGSKLACITSEQAGATSHLSLLDLNTGKITVMSELSVNAAFAISWSPDGQQVAFERALPSPRNGLHQPFRAIYILHVDTGVIARLTAGTAPSWSPSGEWIAFSCARGSRQDVEQELPDQDVDSVCMIRPDGTGHKALSTRSRDRVTRLPPVWSPDSKRLLISEWRDFFIATIDVYMLDIATLRRTRAFKNVPPVFAWRAAR
jgi:Tol biopolymer transport system component